MYAIEITSMNSVQPGAVSCEMHVLLVAGINTIWLADYISYFSRRIQNKDFKP